MENHELQKGGNMITKELGMRVLSALLMSAGISCVGAGMALAETPEGPSYAQENRGEEQRARVKEEAAHEKIDASATLRKSTEVYEGMIKGTHGQVPASVLARAQCVVVLPDLMTGAVVVGGTHGVGVASCKENNRWTTPAFLKMNAVSFGAQLGGKSSDVVLFLVNEQAKNALKRGKFSLGADASVAAGTFDKGFDTSNYGVVAYSRTAGAYAGASISGGNITSDDEDTTAFYGQDMNYAALLEGRPMKKQNAQAEKFTALLPR
jgi:SH3 domain-containing YSC84-like protein 1